MSEIITALGGSAVLIAAVAWLTKSIITHYLSKDVVKQGWGRPLTMDKNEISGKRGRIYFYGGLLITRPFG